MLIEHDVARYTVASDDAIEEGLRQITHNGKRTVICVEPNGVVMGVVTDGDFRRWLLANPDASLATRSSVVANRDFVSARFGAGHQEIERLFTPAIQIIPLLDDRGRLVAVARPRTRELRIAEQRLDELSPVFIIAEIGINHNGSLDAAKRLIEVAAKAGADCAKFQMRDLNSLYRNSGLVGDHREDLGAQYTLDLLERFALTIDEMFEAFDECRSVGITPLCTPWDITSANLLDEYGIPAYKVASADLTNHELLHRLAETGRPIIMSTGMSSESEISESVQLLRTTGSSYALLHCNSTYPAPFKDINLRYMDRLAEIGDCLVGYSGHERGHYVAVAAVARGARIVEKHITLDRRLEGNDHKVSLTPDELITMVREIRNVESALGVSVARSVSQGEMMNRVNLAKSLVARVPISAGQEIKDEDIEVRSPGRGLQPNRRALLVGRHTTRDFAPGDFFFESDLLDAPIVPREYNFRRRWGLPVRYHDYSEMADLSNPDFIEFHMSYRDLELRVSEMVPQKVPLGLVVHSPDLFPGDHILNLASEDDSYWKRSLDELQRVIDVTRELRPRFRDDGPTLIVASLGGFSSENPLSSSELPRLYGRVAEALDSLDDKDVEIIPQTLPPYPWYLGGQLFCNLFVDPKSTVEFAQTYGRRICLDIAHTKLACNQRHLSFFDAVEQLAPHTAHLHVVDAAGIDGEGFQIDEGEVDFRVLAEQIDRLAPHAGFIPEIWQGHQNLGEGFWVALDRLERYL
jgi:N-acetylneuraminate synthase